MYTPGDGAAVRLDSIGLEGELTMTKAEAVKILETELRCVNTNTCNRSECRNCSLVMDEDEIRAALTLAIRTLKMDDDAYVETMSIPRC